MGLEDLLDPISQIADHVGFAGRSFAIGAAPAPSFRTDFGFQKLLTDTIMAQPLCAKLVDFRLARHLFVLTAEGSTDRARAS